ncbi:MAG TPA: ABC transporter permease [Candidatus Limnocylindria bacterium]|nr:ABC transporter permease [Candidatus Limnocylindria bacterium]
MGRYILGRIFAAVPVIFMTAVLIFVIMRLLPGDPVLVIAGQPDSALDEETLRNLREQWGLNEPVWVQFAIWLGKMLTGDFGTSFVTRQPVTALVLPRLGPTLQITMMAWLIAITIGLTVGVVSATAPNSRKDWILSLGSLFAAAVPFFLTASLLMLLFALQLRWLPASGYTPFFDDPLRSLRSTIMPAITLSFGFAAVLARQMRSSMVEVLEQPYITTARSKGLRERLTISRHAMKNAMLPIVTILGFSLGNLFGGSVITERIFAVPGMGRLLVDSVSAREYAVVQAIVFIFAFTVVAANLIVDVLYAFLDPRIRLGARGGS